MQSNLKSNPFSLSWLTSLTWPVCAVALVFLHGCAGPDTQTLAPVRATSKPYKIKGIDYCPQQYYEYEDYGVASWYGGRDGTHGLPQATGVPFDMYKHTAAHKTLPIPCMARVTNMENGRSLVLKISDRGPYKYNRILDVSAAAAQALGFYTKGTTLVHIKVLVDESVCLPENQKAYAREKIKRACPPPTRSSGRSSPQKNPIPLKPPVQKHFAPKTSTLKSIPLIKASSLDKLYEKALKTPPPPALTRSIDKLLEP